MPIVVPSFGMRGQASADSLERVLSTCSTAMARAADEADFCTAICTALAGTGGFPLIWTGVLREARITPVAHAGYEPGVPSLLQGGGIDGPEPWAQAVRTGRTVQVKRIRVGHRSAPWRREARENGLLSLLALPLEHGGARLGVLCVFAAQPNAFDEQTAGILQETAACLAFGMRALRSLRRGERQSDLQEREASLRRILAHEPDGTLVVDPEGRVLFANRAAELALGRPRELLLGSHFGYPILTAEWTEVSILRPDHSVLVAELRSVATEWCGQSAYVISMHDVTERKQFEEERAVHVAHLKRAMLNTVDAVSAVLEIHDPYTAGHHRQVARLVEAIGQEMGLSDDQIVGLRIGASIHDIGKIFVPSAILNRPGSLATLERDLIRKHPSVGYAVFKDTEFPWPIAAMIHQHHERLDGSGYPKGLKDGQICREARILAVADVVDAIAAYRPYRPALGTAAALHEIEEGRGVLYDPEVVDACLSLFRNHNFVIEPSMSPDNRESLIDFD